MDSKVSLLANQEDLINRPESISTEKEATIIETIDHTRPSIGLSSNQQLPLCSLKRTVSGGIEMMSTFSIESICFAQYHPDIYNQSYYSSIPFFDACPTIFPANTIVDMNYDTTTGDTNNDGIDELITIYHYIVTNTQTSDVEEYNKLIISQLNNATGLFETIYSNDLTHLLLWPSIIALDYDGDGQDEIVAGGTVIQDIYDVLYEDLRYVFYDFNPSDNYENPSIYSTLHIRYFDTMNRILIDSYGTISPDFFVNPHFSGKKNFIFEKGDINGDYKEDLLVIHPEGRDRACFDIVSFRDYYYDTLADRTYLRISYKGNRVEEKHMVRPILADFDNDGMDEVIVPRAKIDDYYNQSVDPSIQSKIYKLIGNEFKVIGTFESALMVGAADINGDFRTDIIYYNPNKRSLSTINLYSGFPEDSNETVTREHSNSKYRPNSVSDWRRNVKRVCTPLKIYCEDIDYDGEPEIIVPFEEEYYKWGWTLFIAHYDDMDHLKEHKILSHSFAVYDTVIAPVELPSEEEEWPMNQFQVPKLKTGFEFKHEYEVIFGEDYKPVFGDFDGDACQLQYNSEHWESISEPTVFAVVAPPPTARGHGVNQIQSGGTTIGRSEGTTTGTSETLATHISTVAYVGIDFEAEFNIFGIKLAESGYGAEAGFIINHDTSRTRSESFTITFDESWTFSGEEDGVIYAVTTFQNYNYTFISHRNQSLIGEIVTIRCPEVTAIRKMNLDDFDVTFPQYKLRQSLPLFEHEIGKPETYPRISQIPVSTEDKMVYKTALKEVGRGYGSKSIGISFQSQDATSKSSTLAMGGYAGAYIKLGAGGISVKAGFRFTATESVGSSTNFAIGRGFSFSASVGDLAPVDFSDFRYHFGMFLSEETISYEIEGEDYFIDILMLHYYTEHLGPAYSEGARLGLEIHDDSAFDNLMSNYGFPGFGTESDPYIIENWNRIISNMSAIAIENTSRYFVIQNCNIATSIGEEFTGIYLKNVDGAIIEFCSITGFSTGIFLINCRNIQILNNNIQQSSSSAIYLDNSQNCYISENCLAGRYTLGFGSGIEFKNSSFNEISENDIKAYEKGVLIDESDENRILDNSFSENTFGLHLTFFSEKNIIKGNIIRESISYGILTTSVKYNILEDNSIFDGSSDGICIGVESDKNTFKNNLIFNNKGNGIIINECEDNVIIINSANQNEGNGISLSSAQNNIFSTNDITNNDLNGILILYYSAQNIFKDNIISYNHQNGFRFNPLSYNNIIEDNVITENVEYGLLLDNSYDNYVLNNIVSSSEKGIVLRSHSNNNMLSGNILEYHTNSEAIQINNSLFNSLINNDIQENPIGLLLISAHNQLIIDNNIIENEIADIMIKNSLNNYLDNNILGRNSDYGLYILDSQYNIFKGNFISLGLKNGIFSQNSIKNHFVFNEINDNKDDGIKLILNSNYNVISNNSILNNKQSGMRISESSTNKILGNNISYNLENGISLMKNCHETEIHQNILLSNAEDGIYLYNSKNCTINENKLIRNKIGIKISSLGDYNDIYSNIISECQDYGIFIYNSANIALVLNEISFFNGTGIFLGDSHALEVIENSIFNNNNGIIIDEDCEQITVDSNQLKNNSVYGILIYCNELDVISNFCQNNSIGIMVNGSLTSTGTSGYHFFKYNTLMENNYMGFYCTNTIQNAFSFNSLINNEFYGVYLDHSSNANSITYNEFIENNINSRVKNESFSQAYDSGEENNFTSNYYNEWTNSSVNYLIDGLGNNYDSQPYLERFHQIIKPTVISPNNGGFFSGVIKIEWIPGEDAWGQRIEYSIYYSVDGGSWWYLIVTDLPVFQTSYSWDTTLVADGTNYLVMVMASSLSLPDLKTYDISDNSFTIKNAFRIPTTRTTWITKTESGVSGFTLDILIPLILFVPVILYLRRKSKRIDLNTQGGTK